MSDRHQDGAMEPEQNNLMDATQLEMGGPSEQREGRMPHPKLLILIVDWDRGKKVTDLLHRLHVPSHFLIHGEGTASSEVLDVLGLGSTEKAVVLAIVPHWIIEDLLETAADLLRLTSPGRGIAFALPLSSITNRLLRRFPQEERAHLHQQLEKEVNHMKQHSSTHELIIAIIKRGYSEELMEAAREAGATGGTVVHTRHIGPEESVRKMWGITVQEESELVMILTQKEQRVDIMRAINAACGANCEAAGTIFSLPVESVQGLEI